MPQEKTPDPLGWYREDTVLDDSAIGRLWEFYKNYPAALNNKLIRFIVKERVAVYLGLVVEPREAKTKALKDFGIKPEDWQ